MAVNPSQRPTREWPLLLLAVMLVAAVCAPLWPLVERPSSDAARWTPDRLGRLLLGPEQVACYAFFTWAAFILVARYREVRRQRKCFQLSLLPPEGYIVPEDARLLQRRIDAEVGSRGPFILASLLKLALGKYAISRSARDVSDTLRAQADLHMSRMISSMSLVHYLAWAIPAIGFLGTVRGLAGSLSLGGESQLAVAQFIKEATGHLNIAFDCTLVSLVLSLGVMLILHLVQREEEGLVLDAEQYALERLVARLYDLGSEHPAESGDVSVPGVPRRLVS